MGEEGAEFEASRKPAFLPNELEAFLAGSRELHGRPARAREMQTSAMAEAALPEAPEWIRSLYREGKDLWGFVVLYDSAMQELDTESLEDFLCHWGGFVKFALTYNGSKNIIDAKWHMVSFNAPSSAVVPHASAAGTTLDASDDSIQQNGVVLRRAFREILQDPLQYEQRADVVPIIQFDG
ncbi:hypothetical protein EAE96_002297 [Botrytis aclada]|nr:hypothetical protein EAE96_002297 [Botrytis aclada]